MKLEECNYSTKTIDYLGHVIGSTRVENPSHTTDFIKILLNSRHATILKLLLGLSNVFRRFVSNLSGVTSLLHGKLQKDTPFNFDRKIKS